MNESIKNGIIFICGAALGSAVSWYLLKTKYERIAQEEIDSVKDVYSKRYNHLKQDEKTGEKAEFASASTEINDIVDDKSKYKSIVTDNYTSKSPQKGGSESVNIGTKPYTVSPEEFGEKEGYEIITLTYFADDVLTDDQNVPVDNIKYTVGAESLQKFGEFEDDAVYVRNDYLEIDYEILKDYRKYSDLNHSDAE